MANEFNIKNGFISNDNSRVIGNFSAITISATTYLNLPISGGSFTGGTVSGETIFTNGLTANTISATTYFNLPTDIRVTGGTFSAGTAVYTNNTGGTFSVTGFSTGGGSFTGGTVTGPTNFTNGLTANTISATTYLNLPTDIRVTGGTFLSGTTVFTNNTGGTFSVTGFAYPLLWYSENSTPPTTSPTATGTGSIALGNNAQSLSNDMFVYGDGAGVSATGSSYSNFFGVGAASNATDAPYSNFFGPASGQDATNADNSNFFGQQAGGTATNANNSNFFGRGAGLKGTNANNSNFFGPQSGDNAIDANNSNFFGQNAGFNAEKADNSNFFGLNAGNLATNANNSNFIGVGSGDNATNANNSNFIGDGAGKSAINATYSNFIGYSSGNNAEESFDSNFIGKSAGSDAINASQSNFIGLSAGQNATDANLSNFIGYRAGYAPSSGDSVDDNNIIIGTNITLENKTKNSLNIGGILFGIGTYGITTGNPIFSANTGGRIGIGVVTPQETLHVVGNTRIQGSLSAITISSTTISATTYLNLPPSTFTGGTVTGPTNFTNGLTANTISATTYLNLPGTSSLNCISTLYVTSISGCSPINMLSLVNFNEGLNITGDTKLENLTATTISATTYLNLPLTSFTGGTVTGPTIFTNGLTADTISATTYLNLPLTSFTGGTVSGPTTFTNGLTANTISATTYQGITSTNVTTALGYTPQPTLVNLIFVETLSDLPSPVLGVITLSDNLTYFFTTVIDLAGDRIVAGVNTTILGGSSENCRIKSTGLIGTALITSNYSIPIRNITIEADVALDLQGDGVNTAIDWFGVNFTDCNTVGLIKDYSNVIMQDSAFLNSGGLTFDGTIGTVGFSQCLFNCNSGNTLFTLTTGATITRRFRIIYSSLIVLAGETGINLNALTSIPNDGYILTYDNFTGGGTYLSGVNQTSNKALFINNIGITNTSNVGHYYMQNNATATIVGTGNQNVWFKASGTTIQGLGNSPKWTTAVSNRLTYTGSVETEFVITVVGSILNTGAGVTLGVSIAENGAVQIESAVSLRLPTASVPFNFSLQDIIQVTTGDFFEVWVRNESGTQNITLSDVNVIIQKITG